MYRFLARPRWIGFALLVLLTIAACLLLARWQWHRLHEREAYNRLVDTNTNAAAVTPDELLAPGRPLDRADRWRTVAVTGRYDDGQVLLVRKRTQDGQPGFYVMTPMRDRTGAALWFNRGWIPVAATATQAPEVPPTPAGTVTVVGRMRVGESSSRANPADLPEGQIDRIDVDRISADLGYPAYGGYAEVISETPATVPSPAPVAAPDLGNGPHLSYAVQWVTFAIVAVVGWYVLVRKEVERLAEEREAAAGAGPDPEPDEPARTTSDDNDDRTPVEGNA